MLKLDFARYIDALTNIAVDRQVSLDAAELAIDLLARDAINAHDKATAELQTEVETQRKVILEIVEERRLLKEHIIKLQGEV
jgi:hypothetical protein